jgi:hypothetical protein
VDELLSLSFLLVAHLNHFAIVAAGLRLRLCLNLRLRLSHYLIIAEQFKKWTNQLEKMQLSPKSGAASQVNQNQNSSQIQHEKRGYDLRTTRDHE